MSTRTSTQIYHLALNDMELSYNILESKSTGPHIRQRAREVRDYYLMITDGVTLLERLRRAAAEEAESQERTL